MANVQTPTSSTSEAPADDRPTGSTVPEGEELLVEELLVEEVSIDGMCGVY